MAEMVEFFKLSYYSYRGGKKLHQISSATCIYRTVFELKNILASIKKLLSCGFETNLKKFLPKTQKTAKYERDWLDFYFEPKTTRQERFCQNPTF